MLDARNIYRKVTRKIYDFSPEHQANLTAIVWLYRGQQERFLGLVRDYFGSFCREVGAIAGELSAFEATLAEVRQQLAGFPEAMAELEEAFRSYLPDRSDLTNRADSVKAFNKALPLTNPAQHAAWQACDPLAERARGLIKQVDLLYKLAARACQVAQETPPSPLAGEACTERSRSGRGGGDATDRRLLARKLKQLDEERKQAVEQMKLAVYYHRQIHWLQDRFPEAEMRAVPGLCRVVTRAEIEAADWSLTPGRYVGVAPPEVDEDFDFEQTLKDIHLELADLNREAVELAARIQENFEELGV
jgi:type I restriction enzyme M protein